jgi:hypothetical protein
MKKLAICLLAILTISSAACVWADDTSSAGLPIVVVFGGPVGDNKTPSDGTIVGAAYGFIQTMARTNAMMFSGEIPAVNRAVMEKRLASDVLEKPVEMKDAVDIARILKADYALCVKGSVSGKKVDVNMDLLSVKGGSWHSWAGSEIAQVPGTSFQVNRNNAIITATSAAVSEIIIKAFGQSALQDVSVKPGAYDASSGGGDAGAVKPSGGVSRDIGPEYTQLVKQADKYLAKGDTVNAILAMRAAINVDPLNVNPRLRLAGMYMDAGMAPQSIDECNRALAFHPDNLALHNMLAKAYLSTGALAKAQEECNTITKLDPKDSSVRINLGDISWNLGKPDDAARYYQDAAALDPRDATPHDRLHKYFLARKQYSEALYHLVQYRGLKTGRDLNDKEKYAVVAQVVQDEMSEILGKLKDDRTDFLKSAIVKDDYASECKDADARVDALCTLLDKQSVPDVYRSANAHAVQAASLLSQATGDLLQYFKLDQPHFMDDSDLLLSEAGNERDEYARALKT